MSHINYMNNCRVLTERAEADRATIEELRAELAATRAEIEQLNKHLVARHYYNGSRGFADMRTIERQAAQIEMMREALDDIADDYEDRFDMNSPSTNPGMKYVVKQSREALSTTPDQALEQFAAKVREQCIEACRYTVCGIVGNTLSNSAIAKIRAITELPK